jgi:hypothetical protein
LKRENFEIFNIPENNNISSVQAAKVLCSVFLFGAKSRQISRMNLFIYFSKKFATLGLFLKN